MISVKFSKTFLRCLLGGGAMCIAISLSAGAQVQTSQTVQQGEPTKTVSIESGEVVYVNGDSVVVKMDDGTLRHFDNVPDSVNFMVDGQPVNIHNVKVGMKLQKETITTTTPKVITTVETVSGRVWHVAPPRYVTLTLDNGKNQTFEIPKNQKFMVDGQEKDAYGLRKNMRISAQRVTEVPVTVVTEEVNRTGTAPPPPPPPAESVPILVVIARPAPPVAAESTPASLPATASNVPFIGLLGVALCAFAFVLMIVRRFGSLH